MSKPLSVNADPVDPAVKADTPLEWVCENKAKCAFIAMIVVGLAAMIITTIIVGTTMPEGVDTGELQDQALDAGPDKVSWSSSGGGVEHVELSGTVAPKFNFTAVRIVNNISGALIGFGAFSLNDTKEKDGDKKDENIKWKCLAFLVVAVAAIVVQETLATQFSESMGNWDARYSRWNVFSSDNSFNYAHPTYSTQLMSINPNMGAMWGSVASSMVTGLSFGAFAAKAKKLREENQVTTH